MFTEEIFSLLIEVSETQCVFSGTSIKLRKKATISKLSKIGTKRKRSKLNIV